MARRRRFHSPGTTYHVMLRGNSGQPIFFCDTDRCRFCLFIQEGVERYGHRILSFCFMSNHVHLAIQVAETSLSTIIQNVAFRYSRYINHRLRRIGHLFQGRFKSVLVDSDQYLKRLVRYIHLNPVKAAIVAKPESYRWSSHAAYLGGAFYTWLDTDTVLRRFSDDRMTASWVLKDFVDRGIGLEEEVDFERGCAAGVIGEDAFVVSIRELHQKLAKRNITGLPGLPDVIKATLEKYGVNEAELRAPGKRRRLSHVRNVLSVLVTRHQKITLQELAGYLGRDASGLSRAANNLPRRARTNQGLANELQEAEEILFHL